MALAAAGAIAAIVGAGAGVYGAVQSGANQRSTNRMNAANMAENRRINTRNALQDAINSYQNQIQRALDNKRYDEAKALEDQQRALVNKLATATTIDQDGNTVRFDPLTGTWSTSSIGAGHDELMRKREQGNRQYNASVADATVGGQALADRRSQGIGIQNRERLLGSAMLGQYEANRGRSPASMEAALIDKNVAGATDALQRNGGMAQLAGWRQGSSGSDALIGALARNGQTGTRAAIAEARMQAPSMAANEQDMQAKTLLGPSSTLISRGTADPGTASPLYTGDASNNLLAAIQRSNPAGIGSNLNPRGTNLPVAMRPGDNKTYTPLNASGNMAAGVSESLKSLLSNDFKNNAKTGWNWLTGSTPNVPPTQTVGGITYSDRSQYNPTDLNW